MMKIREALLLLILLILTALSSAESSIWDKVEQLTEQNFDKKLAEEKPMIWLVVFYVPWDDHVKSFAPKLEKSLADLQNKGYRVRFGSVDVSIEKRLGW